MYLLFNHRFHDYQYGQKEGIMPVYLLLLALFPTIALMIFIYYKDSYEKEPVGLLFQLFMLGVVSILPAIILEFVGEMFVATLFGSSGFLFNLFYAFFVVALAEEGVKFLFTYIRTWKSKHFNYKFDGIVFAVFVSLGFATLENILYVFQGGFGTGVLRALLSVPSHAIDAVFMGYFYGLAKQCDAYGDKKGRTKNLCRAYLVALGLHGFYDFCLFQGGIWAIYFLLFVIVIDALAFLRINQSSKENRRIFYSRYNNVYGNVYAPIGYNNVRGPYPYNPVPVNMQPNFNPPYGLPPNFNPPPNGLQPNLNPPPNGLHLHSISRPLQNAQFYIYCIHCGNMCNSNTFYCNKCGNPLYK